MNSALILIDIQNDFLPGGALAVPEGDRIIPVVRKLVPRFTHILATQDWHPADHGSFATRHPGKKPGDLIDLNGVKQVLWPDHCVQNTSGAELAPGLESAALKRIFRKGTDPAVDSYSAFFDNARRHATGLGDYLKSHEISTVFLAGLATDYCVKFSALDAREQGFDTWLITDACRGIDLQPGDITRALKEMQAAGVRLTASGDLPG
ncbi:MAG: bifunctional nicotinamidase/pyrazinamidase [FCB group bacterium]|nr:bifunctional nicotinamidase/pyrazinamidase [FCB group bacterium]